MSEVILPRRVVPQPVPFIVSGGDCGACVLGGMLGLPDVMTTYGDFPADTHEGKPDAYDQFTMARAIRQAMHAGKVDRFIEQPPLVWANKFPLMYSTWGLASRLYVGDWWLHARMAIDAGYYGLARVTLSKKGAPEPPDHWVLICGARRLRPDTLDGTGAVREELLISCSNLRTPAEEWVGVREFLTQWGGYDTMWARPT